MWNNEERATLFDSQSVYITRTNLNSSSEKHDVGLRSNSSPHEVFDKKRQENKAA